MIRNLTKNQREVLNYFIKNPKSEVHLRGLTEEIELSYSSTRRGLKELRDRGFLESEEKGNMTLYRPVGKKFREAKKLVNLENLENSGLTEFLEKELRPEAVVLFGSYLEGQDRKDSDIDLAVVGGRDKELNLTDFEEQLSREIQLTKVEDLEDEEREFKNTLANGLVLQGYMEVV